MSQPQPFPPPGIDQMPWYVVDLQGPIDRSQSCGDGCDMPEQAARRQRVEGLAGPVAAWLRAQADLLDPPRRPTRSMLAGPIDITPEEYRQRLRLDVLPPPTP